MTDITQARLLKAREIAAAAYRYDGPISEIDEGSTACKSALAALNLCGWQPPEDPDERAAWALFVNSGFYGVWEIRLRYPVYMLTLAAFKAGKAAA